MSKIFRLYKGGAATYQGWNGNVAYPYNSNARETIEDPDGASAKNEITSIPSPFARIDLVKTAFREVCKRASRNIDELDGGTIFHKMVSDTLDVGEIFFNIDKFKGKIEIITCDIRQAINLMRSGGNSNHCCVADALDKYLLSDAGTYNFNQLRNIYLLNYVEGPDELNIIGATSPATLFFCGANNLDYVQDVFFANNDRPFDNEYQPLYKRDFEYVKSWWTLRKSIQNFSTYFPEVEEYLNLSFKKISDQNVKNELNAVTAAMVSDFEAIDVQTQNQTDQVEVLGAKLLKKKTGIVGENEFTIKADFKAGVKPVVLPVDAGNKYSKLIYVNGAWGTKNKAPYKSLESDIGKRTLPYDGSEYPFLTVGDFLEDVIVKVPHALNKKYYFDGNIDKKVHKQSFLLPIKPLYFKYFKVDTLYSEMPDGKSAFEMEAIAGGSVKVIIRIPIVGNDDIKYIEYQRLYYADRKGDVSENSNNGGMTEFDFTGFVMPSVRFQEERDARYTVSCISAYSKIFKLRFFSVGELVRDVPVDCRNRQNEFDYKAETYTVEHTNFDFIQIQDRKGVCNIIAPKFPMHQNIDAFEFAVDIGTSNTHIEFLKGEEKSSVPFCLKKTESVVSTFFDQSYREIEGKLLKEDFKDEYKLLDVDFVPREIGTDSDFTFPTRTVLSYAKTTDWDTKLRVFGLTNMCLTYNNRRPLRYNSNPPMVNIKWGSQPNSQAVMQAYINNIMLLIRNKVVANNGDLSRTKIVWFYPNSMSPRRLTQLRDAWNTAYEEMFGGNGQTINISESIAPIQYYFRRYSTATSLVNVDIGGGTTDIAFSSKGNVDCLTSFKFAANSLFEDSLSDINPSNGIVDWFKDGIKQLLESTHGDNGISDLVGIFNNIDGQPANMASFLFSLVDNSATKGFAKNKIDFNRILQDDSKFKIVFVIFYSALIYHIAQIVKVKNLDLPRHIAFSGNGSRVVKIVSSDNKVLSTYTKLIFEKVLGKKFDKPLEILGFEHSANPKESTCKGGLLSNASQSVPPQDIILMDSNGGLVGKGNTYKNLTMGDRQKIVMSIKGFFKLVLDEMPKEINFDKNFGVEKASLQIAREVCCNDLETYLDKGIELSEAESGDGDCQIGEALLFYPIKGALQSLSDRIKEYYT